MENPRWKYKNISHMKCVDRSVEIVDALPLFHIPQLNIIVAVIFLARFGTKDVNFEWKTRV